MLYCLILLCVYVTRVLTGRTFQELYISKKTGLNTFPLKTGFLYKQVDGNPGVLATFETKGRIKHEAFSPIDHNFPKAKANKRILELRRKYKPKTMPSFKRKRDVEDFQSFMHYKPSKEEMQYKTFGFHSDHDDVRTNLGNYDTWPFLNLSPFEYDHSVVDDHYMTPMKEKRYVSGTLDSLIIPVHEHVEEDVPFMSTYDPSQTTYRIPNYEPVTEYYPMYKNPYFYNNKIDEDSFFFNGLDLSDSRPTEKYLDYNYDKDVKHAINSNRASNGEFDKKHYYDKHKDFDHQVKGDHEKLNEKAGYEHAGKNYRGFKNDKDKFAKKVAKEDHKINRNYLVKNVQDKAENKKGFHRVYHKDEYQMDKEFHDNTANVHVVEDKGNSKYHNSGLAGSSESYAAAALGDEANAFHKAGLAETGRFKDSLKGSDMVHEYNNKGESQSDNNQRGSWLYNIKDKK